MSNEEKISLEDLLKSLTGHVVESVEITRKDMIQKISSNAKFEILHVRASVTGMDRGAQTRDLTFSIMDADNVDEGMTMIHTELQEIGDSMLTTLTESRQWLSDFKKKKEISVTKDLTFSLTDVHKLLDHIKGTIAETLRIRKPVESEVCRCDHSKTDHEFIEGLDAQHHCNVSGCLCADYEEAET
ncbi:hypothetical protein ES703_53241 [subsurface metagenome]